MAMQTQGKANSGKGSYSDFTYTRYGFEGT